MSSTSGSWSRTHASASICCWPPDSERRRLALRSGEVREQVEHLGDAPLLVLLVAAVDERRHLEVLPHRHLREHALAAGEEPDAHAAPAARA